MKLSTLVAPHEKEGIDYRSLVAGMADSSPEEKAKMFFDQLPELLKAAYLTMTPRETEIYFVRHGSFQSSSTIQRSTARILRTAKAGWSLRLDIPSLSTAPAMISD